MLRRAHSVCDKLDFGRVADTDDRKTPPKQQDGSTERTRVLLKCKTPSNVTQKGHGPEGKSADETEYVRSVPPGPGFSVDRQIARFLLCVTLFDITASLTQLGSTALPSSPTHRLSLQTAQQYQTYFEVLLDIRTDYTHT